MLGGKAQDSTMRWTTEVSTDNECMYNWFGLKAWKHFCISIYKKDRMESFKFTKPINVSHRDMFDVPKHIISDKHFENQQ